MRCRLIFVASAVLSLATGQASPVLVFSCSDFCRFSRPGSETAALPAISGRRIWESRFAGRRSLLLVVARVCCQLQRDRRSCAGIESVTAGADGTALVPSRLSIGVGLRCCGCTGGGSSWGSFLGFQVLTISPGLWAEVQVWCVARAFWDMGSNFSLFRRMCSNTRKL